MSEQISQKPWSTFKTRIYILQDFNGYVIARFSQCKNSKEDAEHIIKCVNEHDSLVAEVERLKQENNQLREALRMCSPYVFIRCSPCKFCRVPEGNGHTEDCEYIRLTEAEQ